MTEEVKDLESMTDRELLTHALAVLEAFVGDRPNWETYQLADLIEELREQTKGKP